MVVKHEPKTFAELQKFYTDVYTPLYDRFINSGAAPQELHAEAAACLDHLFCHVYTVLGKTNPVNAAWVCPTNAAHRFFKVKVEML